MPWLIISILIVGLDQLTKYLIVKNVAYGGMVTVIEGLFYITHSTNTGAAFGMFQNGRVVFIPLTFVFCAAMIFYMFKNNNTVLRISLALILGGAAGNLIDRMFRAEGVVDFVYIPPLSFIFPNFNIADTSIVVGTCLLAYYVIFIYKEKEKVKV